MTDPDVNITSTREELAMAVAHWARRAKERAVEARRLAVGLSAPELLYNLNRADDLAMVTESDAEKAATPYLLRLDIWRLVLSARTSVESIDAIIVAIKNLAQKSR